MLFQEHNSALEDAFSNKGSTSNRKMFLMKFQALMKIISEKVVASNKKSGILNIIIKTKAK